jgi:hypothetical protein
MSRHPFNFLLPIANSLEDLERMVARPAEVRRTIEFMGVKVHVTLDNTLPDHVIVMRAWSPMEQMMRSIMYGGLDRKPRGR